MLLLPTLNPFLKRRTPSRCYLIPAPMNFPLLPPLNSCPEFQFTAPATAAPATAAPAGELLFVFSLNPIFFASATDLDPHAFPIPIEPQVYLTIFFGFSIKPLGNWIPIDSLNGLNVSHSSMWSALSISPLQYLHFPDHPAFLYPPPRT